MIKLTRCALRVNMFKLTPDEITPDEEPEDVAALQRTLAEAGYEASADDVYWAWLQHSLDFDAGWLMISGCGQLFWLLTFLVPEVPAAPEAQKGLVL